MKSKAARTNPKDLIRHKCPSGHGSDGSGLEMYIEAGSAGPELEGIQVEIKSKAAQTDLGGQSG